jgi:hypothetical protein
VKSTRTLLSVLGSALLLVLGAGLAVADTSAGADPTTSSTTTTPTTTDAGTTSAPTTTDAGTTSTSTPTTTADPTSTASTTTNEATVGSTTTATVTQPPVEQSTTQANPTTPQTTTATPPPPTAPCDTTAITCGNNAATQLAIVSQTCNASSANTLISVDITTLDGKPVNNVTIRPTTSCLNELSITQIVQQYCLGCTIIVLPPPPAPAPFAPAAPAAAPAAERVMAYCMPKPVLRPDGTVGALLYLGEGQPSWDATYAAAIPATYVPGAGMTCPSGGSGTSVPIFTLTVPASFIGQFVNLCLQPPDARLAPLCHSVRIDSGATISVPVTANVKATVTPVKVPAGAKRKSPAAIAKASKTIAAALRAPARTKHRKQTTKGARP